MHDKPGYSAKLRNPNFVHGKCKKSWPLTKSPQSVLNMFGAGYSSVRMFVRVRLNHSIIFAVNEKSCQIYPEKLVFCRKETKLQDQQPSQTCWRPDVRYRIVTDRRNYIKWCLYFTNGVSESTVNCKMDWAPTLLTNTLQNKYLWTQINWIITRNVLF